MEKKKETADNNQKWKQVKYGNWHTYMSVGKNGHYVHGFKDGKFQLGSMAYVPQKKPDPAKPEVVENCKFR